MANISEFYGTVTIKAESFDDLASLIYVHIKMDANAWYNTMLDDYFHYDDFKSLRAVLLEDIDPDDLNAEVEHSFSMSGSGRWAATGNFNWFFSQLFKDHDDEDLLNHSLLIKNKSFIAEFEYIDSEPGCNFVQTGTYTLTYKKGVESHDDYVEFSGDYDATNLTEYDFYEGFDVVDSKYALANIDELLGYIRDYRDDCDNEEHSRILDGLLQDRSALISILEDDTHNYLHYGVNEFIQVVLLREN